MSYTLSYGWGPEETPKSLRYLITILCAVSIFCALIDSFFIYYFGISGPQALLSLSWYGLLHWYIWQPITYLFVLPSYYQGLSLSFFFELLLDVYILWVMGSSLIERVGASAFLRFYFLVGALGGLLTLFCMPLLNQYMELAGPTGAILGVFTAWTMLNPESEVMLFFLIRAKAKWLFLGFVGIFLLINLSHFNAIALLFNFFSILIAYLYATTSWELLSPFSITHSIDRGFIDLGKKIRAFRFWPSSPFRDSLHSKTKIFDFHTGKPLVDDDAFMDEMLNKISKGGERSLTRSERARMKRISETKSKRP